MSVVIIAGGDGRRAVFKLETFYHKMSADQKAAAVALLTQFVDDVDSLCAGVDHDGQQDDDNEQ